MFFEYRLCEDEHSLSLITSKLPEAFVVDGRHSEYASGIVALRIDLQAV